MENNKLVEFQFKGTRDYIQGPDLFNAIVGVGAPSTKLTNISFHVHNFVRMPICQLYLTDSPESLKELQDVAVRCQLDIDSIKHWIAIIPVDKVDTMGKRCAYDESLIVSKCTMGESCVSLNLSSPYSFIETVVGMNKYMHQQLFPETGGKWIFTRIDLPTICHAHENLSLRLQHNMSNRLTKSDIEIDGKKVGDIFFSLVNI